MGNIRLHIRSPKGLRINLVTTKTIEQDAFDRIDFESVSAASGQCQERGEKYRVQCEGFVERGQLQLLLADAGEIMTDLRVSIRPTHEH